MRTIVAKIGMMYHLAMRTGHKEMASGLGAALQIVLEQATGKTLTPGDETFNAGVEFLRQDIEDPEEVI